MSTQDSVSKEIVLDRFSLGPEQIEGFCRKHHIIKLALFGSVLRDDFRTESDIDVLVEFHPDHIPGLMRLAGMEIELTALVGGRRVDMKTPLSISQYFRDEVLNEAEALYVA